MKEVCSYVCLGCYVASVEGRAGEIIYWLLRLYCIPHAIFHVYTSLISSQGLVILIADYFVLLYRKRPAMLMINLIKTT